MFGRVTQLGGRRSGLRRVLSSIGFAGCGSGITRIITFLSGCVPSITTVRARVGGCRGFFGATDNGRGTLRGGGTRLSSTLGRDRRRDALGGLRSTGLRDSCRHTGDVLSHVPPSIVQRCARHDARGRSVGQWREVFTCRRRGAFCYCPTWRSSTR